MNGWVAAVICAGMYLLGYLGSLWDKACERREARKRQAADEPAPSGPWTSPGPDRPPAPSPLTSQEQAFLARLATKYRDDPKAGWKLANFLRERVPGISDLDVMRCTVALMNVARSLSSKELTATDAHEKFLYLCGGAVLDLSAFERQDVPS